MLLQMVLKSRFIFICSAILKHGFNLRLFNSYLRLGNLGYIFYYFRGLYLNLLTHDFAYVLISYPQFIYQENYITAKSQLAQTIIF